MSDKKQKWFINQLHDAIQHIGFKNLKITPRTHSFLIAIAKYADKNGYCWPLESQIENDCGIRKDNQCKYVKSLKKLGYITIKRKFDRKTRMTRNYYTINLNVILSLKIDENGLKLEVNGENIMEKQIDNECSKIEPTVKSTVDPTVKSTVATNRTTHTAQLPNKELLDNVQTETLNDLTFDDFWASYPRKEKKKEAYKIWMREKLFQHAKKIIEDVKTRQAKHDRWEDRSFIPLPSTYLNGEQWNDEIIERVKLPKKQTTQYLNKHESNVLNLEKEMQALITRRKQNGRIS